MGRSRQVDGRLRHSISVFRSLPARLISDPRLSCLQVHTTFLPLIAQKPC